MLEFIWKIPEFLFTTSLILGGLSGYNPFIFYWKKWKCILIEVIRIEFFYMKPQKIPT